jgi:cytochrome c oxidase cbb3-type subunit 4
MYKNILQNIDNIAIWPVVSFVIFFTFFICLLWWVFSVDKTFINKMKELPMDTTSSNKNMTTNEI